MLRMCEVKEWLRSSQQKTPFYNSLPEFLETMFGGVFLANQLDGKCGVRFGKHVERSFAFLAPVPGGFWAPGLGGGLAGAFWLRTASLDVGSAGDVTPTDLSAR